MSTSGKFSVTPLAGGGFIVRTFTSDGTLASRTEFTDVEAAEEFALAVDAALLASAEGKVALPFQYEMRTVARDMRSLRRELRSEQ